MVLAMGTRELDLDLQSTTRLSTMRVYANLGFKRIEKIEKVTVNGRLFMLF